MNNDLISRSALKKEFQDRLSACEDWINHTECDISRAIATRDFCIEVIMTINNAPTVEPFERIGAICNENCGYKPQGECRTCRHRDPEDKKCDCGGQERQGCPFPVSDDYFCKYYEKGGAE